MTDIDPNVWLLGSSTKSAKFPEPGVVVKGEITDAPSLVQQRDFKSGDLKTWDNGDPMMQMRVIIQTTEQTDEKDDGRRAIYIKGQMQQAVAQAVKETGEKGLAKGGVLGIKYEGDAPSERGMSPAKIYRAFYRPPVTPVDDFASNDDGWDQDEGGEF